MKILPLFFAFLLAFYANAKEDNPFYFACKDHPIRTDYLYSGFWKNELPEIDPYEKVTAIGLIDHTFSKIETRIEENGNLIANMQYCYANQSNEYCPMLLYLMKEIIPELVKSLRFHAALAQSNYNFVDFFMNEGKIINESLSFWSVNKELDWEPLTADEMEKIKNTMAKYIKQATEKVELAIKEGSIKLTQREIKSQSSKKIIERYVNKALIKARFKHFKKYKSLLGQMHLLQYITSPNSSLEDVMDAVSRAEKISLLEKNYIEQRRYRLEQMRYTNMNITNDLLELMDYTSMFEEVLLQNPRFCNLAAALMKHRNARSIKITGLIALPTLASSFLMSPVAAIGIGFASGGALALDSQLKLERERMKYFGYLYADENDALELQQVSEAKKIRDFDFILMPIGLGGFGATMSIAKQKVPNIIKMFSTKKLNLE